MVSRLAYASSLAALVALLGLTADAQFGNPLKKIPKPPSVPGSSSPATPAPPRPGNESITEEEIAKFIKAMRVQREVLAKEMVQANALKAKADAAKARLDAENTRRAERMVGTMMETESCKDSFKEKDQRSKEIARLEEQVAAADSRGDEAKSDALRQKLDPLTTALDVDADRACGGKGSAALHDCMAAKKKTLASQGVTEPMLTVQAQGECMQDPATSGFAGATGAPPEEAEERAASDAAAEAFNMAKLNADKAGFEAAGLSQMRFARVDHCVRGRIDGGPGCDEESNKVIDRNREQLKSAVKG
jgi:hypothetical protein